MDVMCPQMVVGGQGINPFGGIKMLERFTVEEKFSIEFDGPAFEQHEISASALAQSLLALDGLARRSAEAAYGKDAGIEIKVKGDFRPGSFIVDMLIEHGDLIASTAGAVAILTGVIKLGKWAFGKKVKEVQKEENGCARVENNAGAVAVFNQCTINVYNSARTRDQLSRLTQTLDMEGAEWIKVSGSDSQAETITKQERSFFRQDEGLVLTDNETESVLEVVGPMLNGSPDGWKFSEGEDGIEFTAAVEDDDFLAAVRDRKIILVNGSSIRAIVRTVQRKKVRTRTERTVVEVKEVFNPED